jgi:hypothetical protein
MCSRDEIKAYLHNISSCNNLTSNPNENHSRMEQMGSERALFWFSSVLVEKEQERESERGYGGYLYPLSQKLAVGRAVPGNSGYTSGVSGRRGPDTPDHTGFADR